jgi:hypothetical protein
MQLDASGRNGNASEKRRQPASRISGGIRDALFFAAAALAGAGSVVLASPEPRLALDSAGNLAGPTCIQTASAPELAPKDTPAAPGLEPARNP